METEIPSTGPEIRHQDDDANQNNKNENDIPKNNDDDSPSTESPNNSFFWKSDACIRNVNLLHGVEFVSPVYLSRFTKQQQQQQQTPSENDSSKNTPPTTIEEHSGILFIQGPESLKRVQKHLEEQESRHSSSSSTSPSSSNNSSTMAAAWALERVVAVPSTTNASEWLGDVNRCIIRLRQSMKRSNISKLNQTVTSHMNVAVIPLETTITSATTKFPSESSNNSTDDEKNHNHNDAEKENSSDNDDDGGAEKSQPFIEYLILREGLHAPKSKRLLHYFDRLPVTNSRMPQQQQQQQGTENSNERTNSNLMDDDQQQKEKEESKRIVLQETANFRPFYENDDEGNEKSSPSSNSFFLSVSSPTALFAPKNHNEQPVHYARNWISTRISGASVPYYSFLTGNSLNVDELHFASSELDDRKLKIEEDDDEDDTEENIENRRTQTLMYGEIVNNNNTNNNSNSNNTSSSLFIADVLKNSSTKKRQNDSDETTTDDADTKNEPKIAQNEYVLVSPVEIQNLNLPFKDDEEKNNNNDVGNNNTNKEKIPLQEHEMLHNRIQQYFDQQFQIENQAKSVAASRVFDKLVESPEYAVCFDLVNDRDKRVAASNPEKKLHKLDAESVDAEKLFVLSHHREIVEIGSKENESGSRRTASLFPVRAGFLNESDDIFSAYLARVLIQPLSSVFRLMHFNVNAFPVGAETTEIHSALHAVVGQQNETEIKTTATANADEAQISSSSSTINKFLNEFVPSDVSNFAKSLLSIRPWLVDFYWDKTKVPIHVSTTESERFSGGKCEITFAQSPSWSFFASWKDRNISQKIKSQQHQHQQASSSDNISSEFPSSSTTTKNNNNNNIKPTTNVAMVQYLRKNREASSAQVSPSPKKYSEHRDPTRAGVLPPGAIRKRPQVGTTRVGANLDETVKDDILKRNQEIMLMNSQSNNNNVFGDFDYVNDDSNQDHHDEDDDDFMKNTNNTNMLNETMGMIELDSTANEATALLISELQNMNKEQQQQQQRGANSAKNTSSKISSLPPLALSKIKSKDTTSNNNNNVSTPATAAINDDSPQIVQQGKNDVNENQQQQQLPSARRLDSEFRRTLASSSSPNEQQNPASSFNYDDDDDYHDGNIDNNNQYYSRNTNNNNDVVAVTVPEFDDLAHAKDHKRAQEISEQQQQQNNNSNNIKKPSYEKISRKRILDQLSTRITSGCKKRYEGQFGATSIGAAVMMNDDEEEKSNSLRRRRRDIFIDETQQPKIIQIADGRTIELGTNYHYRWTRDWDVDVDEDKNNKNHEKQYTYRSFWDKLEFRASCSLLYGFTQATPEFAELTAPTSPHPSSSSSSIISQKNQHQTTPSGNNNDNNTESANNNPIISSLPRLLTPRGNPISSNGNNHNGGGAAAAVASLVTSSTNSQHQQDLNLHQIHQQQHPATTNGDHMTSSGNDNNNNSIPPISAGERSSNDISFARRSYLTNGNNNNNNIANPQKQQQQHSQQQPSSSTTTTTTTRVSKLYSVLNTSAAWIAERHLSAASLLRFRGGLRWSLASDSSDAIPYLDSPSCDSSVSSGTDRSYSEFFKSSSYLSSVFTGASSVFATCIHQPQTAFALELESKTNFLPFGIKTNLFCGGSASCRVLEGSDFLSIVTQGTSAKSDFNGGTNNNNSNTRFSSLVASSSSSSSSNNKYFNNHQKNDLIGSNSNGSKIPLPPMVARAAESRVRDYLDRNAQNSANNFLTSTLNLRAVAEFVAGFSFFIPLARHLDAYSETDVVDGYSKRLEFSYWIPLWSYDSFDMRKTTNHEENNTVASSRKWNYRVGLNLIL